MRNYHYNGHTNYLDRLKVGVKVKTTILTKALTSSRVEAKFKESEKIIQKGNVSGVIFEVEHESEIEKIEHWRQGDATLHTKKALAQRHALRHHPAVMEALDAFWWTAVRSLQVGLRAPLDGSFDAMTREGHSAMLMNVYRSLMDDWDQEDAEASVAEDWENDRRGGVDLPRINFMDALFELVDVRRWASNLDPLGAFGSCHLACCHTSHASCSLKGRRVETCHRRLGLRALTRTNTSNG